MIRILKLVDSFLDVSIINCSIFIKHIDEGDASAYKKFKKKFSLSSVSAEIAKILDEEMDVARFYAELVPIELQPNEFWGR